MRIAIDCTSLLPEATGVDTYMLRLIEHLRRIDRQNAYRVVVNGSAASGRSDRITTGSSDAPQWMAIPAVADSVGELSGYVTGGGSSAERLR